MPSGKKTQDAIQLDNLVDRHSDDSAHLEKSASQTDVSTEQVRPGSRAHAAAPYMLYKRRWLGVAAMFCLNGVGGMVQPWWGPIANDLSADFHVSLTKVNWLMNIIVLGYLPVAWLTPLFVGKYGLRRACDIGALALLLSAWIRYGATPTSLSTNSAYAIFFIAQMFASIGQAIFQIIVPAYSENWFDLKGRTTATMIMSVANPVGGAIAQVISPLIGDTRQSILVLGIMTTVAMLMVFTVQEKPPTPPTYSGGLQSPHFLTLFRAMFGMDTPPEARMSLRERIDFSILTLTFSGLVTATNVFSILNAQYLQPYGYSSDVAGFMGATLLVAGLLAAAISSPVFDRVMTHHFGTTVKTLCPIVGAGWLSLIWAIRPHNTIALFVIMAIIGICSVTILPVGLELGCELTRNAEGSSAIMWSAANAISLVFLLVENAMRAGADASPPLNMHRSIIFNGVIVFALSLSVLLLNFHGRQTRRMLDEQRANEERPAVC